jgi:inhibitor of KinA sporulation pathway (predicted exonuclease)
MQYWLVIDLEATTEEGGWPLADMEIIEIGASLVNTRGHEVDHFQRFVRPLRRPQLTPFCRQLTRIQQASIDAASPLPALWPSFERWLENHRHHLLGWASWGDYDRLQLEQEWHRHGLHSLLATLEHCNLKQRFAEVRQLAQPVGMNRALQLAGLQFQGTQHRALEDARNTARLLPLILPARNKRSG